MEYMKIDNFLGATISKLVNKAVETKVGFKPNINLHGLNFCSEGETIELNLKVTMSKSDFEKLIEEAIK